ncbi:MAG: AI-2E family transporter [Gammaproteobacteria bacterium]
MSVSNIKKSIQKYFSHPEAILILFLTTVFGLFLYYIGNILAPVLASVILAYCLEWFSKILMKLSLSRKLAISIVFLLFIGIFVVSIVVVLPMIWQQGQALSLDLPNMLNKIKENSKHFLSEQQMTHIFSSISQSFNALGSTILTVSWSSISSVMTWLVYMILVPVMIFFMLTDKEKILNWINKFLPKKTTYLNKILKDLDIQIGNYIRGKMIEMLVTAAASYIAFWFVDLKYNALLSFLIGFSVIIPFVGAVAAIIPLVLVAYLQFGWSDSFGYIMLANLIIQIIDGNILVPLLFSGTLNLHPLAILVSILVFGGLWGFWGVFFAIPLVTLIKILMQSWPLKQSFNNE